MPRLGPAVQRQDVRWLTERMFMTAYDDFSPASEVTELTHVEVLRIGWLEAEAERASGERAPVFRSQLHGLCQVPWQPLVVGNQRGRPCGLCLAAGAATPDVPWGFRNLYVPDAEKVYLAPEALGHYVDVHEYCPPEAFQAAVGRCPPIGSRAYLDALARTGWPTDCPTDDGLVGGQVTFWLTGDSTRGITQVLRDFGATRDEFGGWIYGMRDSSYVYVDIQGFLDLEWTEMELYYEPLHRLLGQCEVWFARTNDANLATALRDLAAVVLTTCTGLVEFRCKNGLAWMWTDSEIRAGAFE